MSNILKFILALVLVMVLVVPAIIKWIHPQPTDSSIYEKLQHERDSLMELNVIFKYQRDSIQVLANRKDSVVVHEKTKVIYLTNKKDERIKILTNATPTQRDSFLSTIHIKAVGH